MSTSLLEHPALVTPSIWLQKPHLNSQPKSRVSMMVSSESTTSPLNDDYLRWTDSHLSRDDIQSNSEATENLKSSVFLSELLREWNARIIGALICWLWSLTVISAVAIQGAVAFVQLLALSVGVWAFYLCLMKALKQHFLICKVVLTLVGLLLLIESIIVAFYSLGQKIVIYK